MTNLQYMDMVRDMENIQGLEAIKFDSYLIGWLAGVVSESEFREATLQALNYVRTTRKRTNPILGKLPHAH